MSKINRFELRKLKVNESMSEETLCFSADLYENGKLIAHISNRGQGGSNEVYPANGLTYKDVAHIENLDTECEILGLAEELNTVKKSQAKAFVLKKGGEIFLAKQSQPFTLLKKYGNYAEWLKNNIAQFKEKGYEVLNTNL